MTDKFNELNFRLWFFGLSARGATARYLTFAVSLILAAVAWRIVRG